MKGFVVAVPWSVCRRRAVNFGSGKGVAHDAESVKGLRPSGSLLVFGARSRARCIPRVRRLMLRAPPLFGGRHASQRLPSRFDFLRRQRGEALRVPRISFSHARLVAECRQDVESALEIGRRSGGLGRTCCLLKKLRDGFADRLRGFRPAQL